MNRNIEAAADLRIRCGIARRRLQTRRLPGEVIALVLAEDPDRGRDDTEARARQSFPTDDEATSNGSALVQERPPAVPFPRLTRPERSPCLTRFAVNVSRTAVGGNRPYFGWLTSSG